jgi:YesN/AraC family two-component response regulator
MTDRLTKGQLYARLRCLIVDDSKTVRGGLKAILLTFGVKIDSILEAQNLSGALKTIELDRSLDIVFCDISLGDGYGMQAFKAARDIGAERSPSFIFISSDVSNEHLKEFIELGVRDVLLKPLSAHAVESSMNRQLPKILEKMKLQ